MNSLTVKIVLVIIIFVILQFAAQKVISMFNDDYKTETATLYSSAEKLSLNAVYVRDEQVVTTNAKGVLSYPNEDGSKIAKNSVVAYVYR
ncbi:MAG: HlyD family efflux transporter periplasmic adaptor subunit, partial [Oscillospiraceae bacterium]